MVCSGVFSVLNICDLIKTYESYLVKFNLEIQEMFKFHHLLFSFPLQL